MRSVAEVYVYLPEYEFKETAHLAVKPSKTLRDTRLQLSMPGDQKVVVVFLLLETKG